jgi:hypothetical protein
MFSILCYTVCYSAKHAADHIVWHPLNQQLGSWRIRPRRNSLLGKWVHVYGFALMLLDGIAVIAYIILVYSIYILTSLIDIPVWFSFTCVIINEC